jgi:hypothetical protein
MCRFVLLALIAAFVPMVESGLVATQAPADEPFVRPDPAFDRIGPADATLELLEGGLGFLECPVWVEDGPSSDYIDQAV